MKTCFVMQVFDGAEYDTRFQETFQPALLAAGATPVRADKILGTRPIIDKIEGALKDATIAFAEISENNANVFIELGYALDQGIPLVMVCDRGKRASLPFDIQHRPVIFYQTRSQGDFTKLGQEIEAAARAALIDAAQKVRQQAADKPETGREIDDLKNDILLHVLEIEVGSPVGASAYSIRTNVTRLGYSDKVISLAMLALTNGGFLKAYTETDRDGDPYTNYGLTDTARNLLLSQYADIKRQDLALSTPVKAAAPKLGFADDLDDDVPF